ncbi:uncharacterized protein LOC143043733 [Mytilus galloprovincialis]|uniref:uncharacterized protein LOC143043733 n=1 Tax=Mytilus galloprovincialis TaxID=29158 RepID=UPI003F7C626B
MDNIDKDVFNLVPLILVHLVITSTKSDIETSVSPAERVFITELGMEPNDDAVMCSTFCQYTQSPTIRTLRKPGTNDVLPNDAALCEPCDSACVVDMTTESNLISTTSISISTSFKASTELSETTPKRTTSAEFKISPKMTTESALETATTIISSTYLTESTKKDEIVPILTTPTGIKWIS